MGDHYFGGSCRASGNCGGLPDREEEQGAVHRGSQHQEGRKDARARRGVQLLRQGDTFSGLNENRDFERSQTKFIFSDQTIKSGFLNNSVLFSL